MIYVGVTRAEKLLAIALPAAVIQRVAAVLHAGQVPFEIHDLAVAAAVGEAVADGARDQAADVVG